MAKHIGIEKVMIRLITFVLSIVVGISSVLAGGQVLREDTATQIAFGPFIDGTDFITPETALTVTQWDCALIKHADSGMSATSITITASAGSNDAVHLDNGYYSLELTATDTNTAGRLVVQCDHATPATFVMVWADFMVMPTQEYDSLYGTDKLQAHVVEYTAGVIDSNAVGTLTGGDLGVGVFASGAITADAIATGAIGTTEFAAETDIVSSGAITTSGGAVTTVTTAGLSTAAVDAIWDEDVVTAHDTANSAGNLLEVLGDGIENRANNPSLNTLLGVADTVGTDLPEQVWAEGTRTVSAATNITDDGGVINVTTGAIDTVNALGAGAVDATAIATDAIDADAIAADAVGAAEAGFLTDSTGFAGANIDQAISANATPAEVNAELVNEGLDHLVAAAVVGADITDNSIIAKLAADDATADWDTFDNTTDSLEAIRIQGDAAWTTGGGTGLTALDSGTLRAGGTSTQALLPTARTFADDILNGTLINIHTGTGAGQARLITDYTNSTDTATTAPAWTTNPDATSQYEIVQGAFVWNELSRTLTAATNITSDASAINVSSGVVDTVTTVNALGADTITAASIQADAIGSSEIATAAIGNDEFNVTETLTANPASGGIVAASFGAGAIDAAAIAADAIGSSELATDAIGAAEIAADAITTAEIADDATMKPTASGTANAGAAGSIDLAAASTFPDDTFNNMAIRLIGGTGVGQCRLISDYTLTNDRATVNENWTTTPDNTSVYQISDGICNTLLTAANVNSEVDTALADVNLDHLVGTATGIPALPADTYLDTLLDDGTTAYDRTTDSLQEIRDWVGDGTNLTEAGGTGDQLTAIDLPNQTMDITGNLSGSVGSVTGAVGSVTNDTDIGDRSLELAGWIRCTVETATDAQNIGCDLTNPRTDTVVVAQNDDYIGRRIIVITSSAVPPALGENATITDSVWDGVNSALDLVLSTKSASAPGLSAVPAVGDVLMIQP